MGTTRSPDPAPRDRTLVFAGRSVPVAVDRGPAAGGAFSEPEIVANAGIAAIAPVSRAVLRVGDGEGPGGGNAAPSA